MNEVLKGLLCNAQEKIRQISDFGYGQDEMLLVQNGDKFRRAIEEIIAKEESTVQSRVLAEYFSYGPLELLFEDEEVSEILVNGPDFIWCERKGRLELHQDSFFSESTYIQCFHRLCEKARCQSTVEFPAATGQFKDFRLTVIRKELTRSSHHISFRRHPKNPWTLGKFREIGWASDLDIANLQSLVHLRKNFLIIGGTGTGKTSLINALLQILPPSERAIVIEDTPEIVLPNHASLKMLTREDPQGLLKDIDQGQLLRHSLRLRPDRIVLGEIRGTEAKDLLMALATGHGGSFGSLHASDPRQALIRLEMLIQMGAPQWSLQAVRRLIHLSLDYILVIDKQSCGKRQLQGLYKICSLEENGFLIERVQATL